MRNLYLSLFVFCCTLHASAQFSGAYAPSNWSLVLSAKSNGSVDVSGAPASITLTGSNDPSNPTDIATPVTTDYVVTASTSGIWKFTWTYHSSDQDGDPQYDPAGILINGVFTPITSNTGGVDQSGTFTAPSVTAGTVIGFRISTTDNSYGNATLTISAFAPPSGITPVTLISFAARPQAQAVQLQWKTADESNLKEFTIERSADGIHFAAVATVAARNVQNAQAYEAIDAAPLSGISYYRLRIKEQRGEDKFSAVVSVKRESSIRLQVYPNPVKNWMAVTVHSDRAENTKLELADAGGRILHTKMYRLQAGQQSLSLDYLPLAKGIYYLRLQNTVIPFVKD